MISSKEKNNYIENALIAIQHPKKEQSEQVIQNIVEKMDMMISLVTTYMTIESESIKRIKRASGRNYSCPSIYSKTKI